MESSHELLVTLVRLISSMGVVVLFFLFIVRPLLNYFIVKREIAHQKRVSEEAIESEDPPVVAREEGSVGVADAMEAADDLPSGAVSRRRLSDLDTLNRLAASDPEKAGELVKQWVNTGKKR